MNAKIKPSHQTPSAPTPALPSAQHVQQLRSFNRFYTQRIGVLAPYLGSELSLTDVRVLYELAHSAQQLTAKELTQLLSLDAGYVSRILRRFEREGWIARTVSPTDARASLLQLTQAGHAAFAPLEQKSRDEAAALLGAVPEPQRPQLLQALRTVQTQLAPDQPPTQTVQLRDPRPGDLGWVVQQHGEIYAREYGWDSSFEALVANIAAEWLRKADPEWEKGWIAELNGERVGSIFVMRKSPTVAQLRMLILSPSARGLGLGSQLVDETLRFARAKGYRKMVLWTNSCLTAARTLYAQRGFNLIKSEPYHGYGHDLVGETWELKL